MSFDDDEPTPEVVTSRKEEAAVEPTHREQNPATARARVLLVGGSARYEHGTDRPYRLQAGA
ncbi:hypothetical protein [Nocardia jejuensis]|uniref:hypothetical protein n=1 Tax=Nocardia jejuensis TaxID=328049 RepID=UPI000831C245|nr:hypothetical protein [Nocardia jejuensis]